MAELIIKEFPDDLHEALVKRASLRQHSLEQEVIYLLGIALKTSDQISILQLRGLGNGIDIDKHMKEERGSWE